MKNLLILLIPYMFLFISCEKENGKSENKVMINILEFSACTTKAANKAAKIQNYCVNVKSLSDNYLEFAHQDSEFCCSTDLIGIDCKVSGDSIFINEIDNGPFSYCYCPHDIKFKIGPLNHGKYEITIIESASSYKRDTIQFEYNHVENSDFTIIKEGL